MAKILFVVSFPVKMHSSSRFRIEIYEPILSAAGHRYKFAPFWSQKAFHTIYKPGRTLLKATQLAGGLLRRFFLLFRLFGYDYVFILREAAPVGPPVFEWICAKIFRKKIIYDFDDAIWIQDKSEHNALASVIKANWKVKYLCKWAYKVSAGNKYLQDYAKKYNEHVLLNPTCVDTDRVHNRLVNQANHGRLTIGWTGSFSTLKFLHPVVPMLQQIENQYDVDFVVIADKNPDLALKNYRFIPWQEATEIDDLLNIQIGIMPLKDDRFSEGKCGFKLIQYMSLGMPVLASPVGVNTQIIADGKNGYLCKTDEDWHQRLKELIDNPELRQQMGKLGRDTIVNRYSVNSNAVNFLSLFS